MTMEERIDQRIRTVLQYYLGDDEPGQFARGLLVPGHPSITGDELLVFIEKLERCAKKNKAKENLRELRGCL